MVGSGPTFHGSGLQIGWHKLSCFCNVIQETARRTHVLRFLYVRTTCIYNEMYAGLAIPELTNKTGLLGPDDVINQVLMLGFRCVVVSKEHDATVMRTNSEFTGLDPPIYIYICMNIQIKLLQETPFHFRLPFFMFFWKNQSSLMVRKPDQVWIYFHSVMMDFSALTSFLTRTFGV